LDKFIPISGKSQVFLYERSVSSKQKAVFGSVVSGQNCWASLLIIKFYEAFWSIALCRFSCQSQSRLRKSVFA